MARGVLSALCLAHCVCACGASIERSHDAALPAINVKFDFPAKDTAGGGSPIKRNADLRGFNQRVANLVRNAAYDKDVFTQFYGIADKALDDLANTNHHT